MPAPPVLPDDADRYFPPGRRPVGEFGDFAGLSQDAFQPIAGRGDMFMMSPTFPPRSGDRVYLEEEDGAAGMLVITFCDRANNQFVELGLSSSRLPNNSRRPGHPFRPRGRCPKGQRLRAKAPSPRPAADR
jgi:hypothetical protein